MLFFLIFFFFKQKTAYEMRISDWSSDVCSSDLSSYSSNPKFLSLLSQKSMLHTQLRSFHAVASEGGFTAASRKLNIGQPTITSQVRDLENYFKVELFVRRGRRVELTDAGRQLHTLTQRLMTLEQDASDLLRGLGGLQRGTLKLEIGRA